MTVQAGDKEYLRNTLVEPMPTATTAGVAGAGAHAAHRAPTARKIGEKVLKWQASQGCHRIPNPRSLDKYEKSLGKSFQDVLRRRYGAIGEKPCQQQLSADEIHLINGIPGVQMLENLPGWTWTRTPAKESNFTVRMICEEVNLIAS